MSEGSGVTVTPLETTRCERSPTVTEDTVGRLGGDEFAVICENSIGIASPLPGETSSQMLERVDSTMYQAKAARNVV